MTTNSDPSGSRLGSFAADPPFPGDYNVVRQALAFLTERSIEQPDLDALASHLGLSAFHVQRLFKRWCGLSPKEFTQALTLHRARELLENASSVLETALTVGLSGSSRLHDLFVTFEAVTPGDVRRRGAGLELTYGTHTTPFGWALAARSSRGLVGLAFIEAGHGDASGAVLDEMMARWPLAHWRQDSDAAAGDVAAIFGQLGPDQSVPILLIGTDFEVRVWRLLTHIPVGKVVSYRDIAGHLGEPNAARAVGAAVGRNPLAFVVPCHRVIRSDGGLGGYHWTVTRKRALIGWEAGQQGRRDGG